MNIPESSSRSCLSIWSADAAVSFLKPWKKTLTAEFISRVEAFVESYILYDYVLLPERYADYDEIKELGSVDGVFKFYAKTDIAHSCDIIDGISFNLNLNFEKFEKLKEEDKKWYLQHNGDAAENDWEEISSFGAISMANLRLWQACLCNELTDKFSANQVLPLSLNGLDDIFEKRDVTRYFVAEKYHEFSAFVKATNVEIIEYTIDQSDEIIKDFPPFTALMVDQTHGGQSATEILKKMRSDYRGLRELQSRFSMDIASANEFSKRKEILSQWKEDWSRSVAGEFKKPSLLRKIFTASEVGKAVGNVATGKPQAILGGLAEKVLEYPNSMRAYNRFQVFSDLLRDYDWARDMSKKLEENFGIEGFRDLK
ncbi:hypothetical protein [Azospirillum sp. TSH100]|uniref:hypothetical protein n=1 Tax=Azospirillum sp. TSH100 TaxID=652764 RepID=UPI0010AAC6AE|nr:hypothetical protein [Azospirillum sp. TSH100]QCG89134.1 hypothetical protein E6C72_15075 [Azospirillum sp. TSH100]